MDKNVLISLRELLKKNKKYNPRDLYVCRFKFKDSKDVDVSERCICKVSSTLIGTTIIFENLILDEVYKAKKENDSHIEVLEMIQFVDVFPDVFYPSLNTISSLTDELKKDYGFIKTLR